MRSVLFVAITIAFSSLFVLAACDQHPPIGPRSANPNAPVLTDAGVDAEATPR